MSVALGLVAGNRVYWRHPLARCGYLEGRLCCEVRCTK